MGLCCGCLGVHVPITSFKQIFVSYHNALKRMLNVPKFYGNHFTCDIFNTYTFKNFLNVKI